MATQIERYTRIVAGLSDGRLEPGARATMVVTRKFLRRVASG